MVTKSEENVAICRLERSCTSLLAKVGGCAPARLRPAVGEPPARCPLASALFPPTRGSAPQPCLPHPPPAPRLAGPLHQPPVPAHLWVRAPALTVAPLPVALRPACDSPPPVLNTEHTEGGVLTAPKSEASREVLRVTS